MSLAAWAADVKLTSRDGKFAIEGTLLTFDGEFYRLETIYGPLTLDGQGVLCEGPGCPKLDSYVAEIRISGSRRMAELLIPSLIRGYAARQGYTVLQEVEDDTHSTFLLSDTERVRARFKLRSSTTSEGYADLIAEEADIALVLREPSDSEAEMARLGEAGDLLRGRRARVLARDGIVVIRSDDQPVTRLSFEQIVAAVSGDAQRWSDLDGPDVPLILHLPLPYSGLAEAFRDLVMEDTKVSPRATLHASMEDLSDAVASDSFALGITTLSEMGNAAPISILGACGFEMAPSLSALRAEDYPLSLPMMLYTPARRLPLMAREFLKFTQSPEADRIIRLAGFVDQTITGTDFKRQGDRLANGIIQAGNDVPLEELKRLVALLADRQRLSSTFRFVGGTRLDVQSRENIIRLARSIEAGFFNGRDLLLVGFSDAEGPAGPNLRLSKSRAETVLNLLTETAEDADWSQLNLGTEAFGEALPIACDDADWGRALNRRVEVWVK